MKNKEAFLSHGEWESEHGEKYVQPKFSARGGGRGVDVDRCRKIASGKNAKIGDRNLKSYLEYLKEWEARGNSLLNVPAEQFKFHIYFLGNQNRRDEAITLLDRHPEFEKTGTEQYRIVSEKQIQKEE